MTKTVSVAEAKKHLSEILGHVAFGGDEYVIARRGKPMGKLVPMRPPTRLSEIKGWLPDDDPFFAIMDDIVASRHRPRGRAPRR